MDSSMIKSFVVKSSGKHGYLPEQVNNETMEPAWVIGLGWSHAMYIIALSQLGGIYGKS